jgi:repressor LexA
MEPMLTRKQYELLMFIHERVRESGIPPSFDEMKDALDLKSKSGIHRLITALEERGFLRRMEKRARALEIMKLPDNVSDTLRPATSRSQAQRPATRHGRGEGRISSDARAAGSPRRAVGDGENAVNVPLVGRIAAGTPIEALQNKVGEVPVPGGMIGPGGPSARSTGDSMISAGILDGDTVIIRKLTWPTPARSSSLDNQEATLKRCAARRLNCLEATNPATKRVSTDRPRAFRESSLV